MKHIKKMNKSGPLQQGIYEIACSLTGMKDKDSS